MSATRYEETTPAPRWMRAAGAVVLASAVVLLLIAVRTSGSGNGDAAGSVVGTVVCAAVGLVLLSVRMRLRVSEDTLTLGLVPLVRRRIPLAAVATASVEEVRPAQFGGIGYRIAGSDRAFLFSAGRAVLITVTGSRRRYFWRTEHPADLLARIAPR